MAAKIKTMQPAPVFFYPHTWWILLQNGWSPAQIDSGL